ncbi:protein grindelwald [Temnothorax curvispinosus]|uniref:Protein grindelwald n=1 Tax=Temnothorax curvispinosus TaxID=300111 RepID=A0A6J1PD07_9HYME|nr:protein grindelwald [Temnothorax curvispinosus]
MTLIVTTIVALSVLPNVLLADLDPRGIKCGEKFCNISEYCSPFDQHCRPCAIACNVTSHNYQPEECAKDCQFYLHDQRYVQRMDQSRQYDDLREEVEKLKYRFVITTTLTCFSLFGMLYLLGRTLIRWKRIQHSLQTVFRRNIKLKANKNKVQDDVEAAVNKQNGLKLTIPSISGTVEQETKIENNNSSSNSNSNGINTTPNTTSTPLSRRHASEDTTLDYAYDNPAMTPSPDAAQLKTKARESSF